MLGDHDTAGLELDAARRAFTDLGAEPALVGRHVANIFSKLDVSSRSAATAYAYRHDLA